MNYQRDVFTMLKYEVPAGTEHNATSPTSYSVQ